MSVKNTSNGTQGAEIFHAPSRPSIPPITSSYVQNEQDVGSGNTDTTKGIKPDAPSGGAGDGDLQTGQTDGLTAKSFTQRLLGPSLLKWGGNQSGEEASELEVPALKMSSPFAERFNTLTPKTPETVSTSDTADDGNPEGAEADKSKDTKSPEAGLFSSLVKSVGKAVTDQVDAAAAVGDALVDTTQAMLGFGPDREAERVVATAEKGKKLLDAHDDQFVRQWQQKPEAAKVAPPKEGDDPKNYTVKNEDGSSYKVLNGNIQSFTTRPSKGFPDGATYSDITYDSQNMVTGYTTPFNQRHTREGTPDARGFAMWNSKNAKTNAPEKFGETSRFMNKPMVGTDGIHMLIGNGPDGGTLFSRSLDGTTAETRGEYSDARKSHMKGLTTKVTLDDGTKVSRHGTFSKGKLTQDNSDVSVKEADAPKVTHVKFNEGDKAEVIEQKKGNDLLKPKGDANPFKMIEKLLAPESESMLKDINYLNITRSGDAYQVQGNLKNVFMAPPNLTLGGFGPLGRVSATPQGGYINEFSMYANISDKEIGMYAAHGFDGTAALTREPILKRRGIQNIGSRATSTEEASLPYDGNTLVAKSRGQQPMTLTADNYRGTYMETLLTNKAAKDNAFAMANQFKSMVDGLQLADTKEGIKGSIALTQKQFELKSPMPGVKTNLYANDKVNFEKKADGIYFKEGDLGVGIQVGKSYEDRMSISKISKGVGKDGKPTLDVEFHGHPEKKFQLPMPEGTAPPPEPAKKVEPTRKQATKEVAKPTNPATREVANPTNPTNPTKPADASPDAGKAPAPEKPTATPSETLSTLLSGGLEPMVNDRDAVSKFKKTLAAEYTKNGMDGVNKVLEETSKGKHGYHVYKSTETNKDMTVIMTDADELRGISVPKLAAGQTLPEEAFRKLGSWEQPTDVKPQTKVETKPAPTQQERDTKPAPVQYLQREQPQRNRCNGGGGNGGGFFRNRGRRR